MSVVELRNPAVALPIKAPYPLDTMNQVDGLVLLRATPAEFSKLVIFDPQYRQNLDKLAYGNEGKRQKERCLLPQMSDMDICGMGTEIVRVLKPSGYCLLWANKFIVCERLAPGFFGDKLVLNDLIVWDTGKFGMGSRSRNRAEFLVILQKPPTKAKATWTRHDIPNVWEEGVWREKIKDRIHVHQKPFELQKALIEATTEPSDVVIDPTAGSFSVMHCAHACGRRFLGGDLLGDPATRAPSIVPAETATAETE